jgi:hypothetical protein
LHVGNAHNTPQTKKYENRQRQQLLRLEAEKQTTSADMNACPKKPTTNLEESEKKKNAAGNANPPMQQLLLLELEKSNPQLKQQKNNTTCNRNKRLLYSLNC